MSDPSGSGGGSSNNVLSPDELCCGGGIDDDEATLSLGVEQARHVIRQLREKSRCQSQMVVAWKRRLKEQNDTILKLQRERDDQIKQISSQLFLFESKLRQSQREINEVLKEKERRIKEQDALIEKLETQLMTNGCKCGGEVVGNDGDSTRKQTGSQHHPPSLNPPTMIITSAPDNSHINDANNNNEDEDVMDSLGNDSDSAIIMEESVDAVTVPRFRSTPPADVKIVRSVSDAVERVGTSSSLKRPEVLETVYSVEEEDYDNYASESSSSDDDEEKEPASSYEKLVPQDSSPTTPSATNPTQQVQVTYNRVMSNHRAVVKPKDVKYKRINKARSRSLEELRGKLKGSELKGTKSGSNGSSPTSATSNTIDASNQ